MRDIEARKWRADQKRATRKRAAHAPSAPRLCAARHLAAGERTNMVRVALADNEDEASSSR